MPLTPMRRTPTARMGMSLTHTITAMGTAMRTAMGTAIPMPIPTAMGITSLRWLCRPLRLSEAPRGLSRVTCGRVVAFSLEVF
ncbi:hypothetical protein J2S75_001858 [Ancylobacter polymorphus]|uniref:Uncharacterized protein n=1 Tax=Ancylobacter polymorphus TaxID=223390 RepID=A0ABU0BBR2_9HYPH|nr:hypothetical protein [Ancylobacter polymorphus]